MLIPLDESPWHQLPTTFDHVATSDPRFFDRFWFAASDRRGSGALQFTTGVYQNMNVVDGGFVVIHRGRQHNLRVSRQLRPAYDTACGPLRFDVLAPFETIALSVAPNAGRVHGELTWSATVLPRRKGTILPGGRAGWSRITVATTRSADSTAGSRSTANASSWPTGGPVATTPGASANGSASPSRTPARRHRPQDHCSPSSSSPPTPTAATSR